MLGAGEDVFAAFVDFWGGSALRVNCGSLSAWLFQKSHRARTEGWVQSARVTPQACLRHDGGGSGAAQSEIGHLLF